MALPDRHLVVGKAELLPSGQPLIRPYALDLNIWNTYFNFSGIVEQLSSDDRRLVDPTFLVIQLSGQSIVDTFQHLLASQLVSLARAHYLPVTNRRKEVLEAAFASHHCSVKCGALLYAFKQLAQPRTTRLWNRHTTVERLQSGPHGRQNEGNEQIPTFHSSVVRGELSSHVGSPGSYDVSACPGSYRHAQIITNMITPRPWASEDARSLRTALSRASSISSSDFIAVSENCANRTTKTSNLLGTARNSDMISPPSRDRDASFDTYSWDHLRVSSEDEKMSIIEEWQKKMALHKFLRRPCASCSSLTLLHDLQGTDATSLDLTVLRNDELPNAALPSSYNFQAYDRAILEPLGLDNRDLKGVMFLCRTCHSDLKEGRMPRFALANWLYYARDELPTDVRLAFRSMSPFEKTLVCRVRTNSLLCRFSGIDDDMTSEPFVTGNRHIRGNIISTPLDVVQVNNMLPPTPAAIGDTMCALIISSKVPDKATISKLHPILVRKSRVKMLIEFLLQSNPHYTKSDSFGGYSAENLETLFGGNEDIGVPTCVRIGVLPVNEAVESTVSDYTGRLDGSRGLLMENVSYTLGDTSAVSYQEMTLQALQHCRTGKPFLYSRSGSDPVPDINNPNWLSWAHPDADPFGIGSFHHPRRKRPIGMEQQLRHLLTVQDPFFENDPQIAFDLYNIIRKAAVNTSLRFRVPYTAYTKTIRDIAQIDKASLAELKKKFDNDHNYQPATEEEKKIVRIMTSISPVARKIPGSVAQTIRMRNEIRAMISQKGSPTLFVTLNPSDYYHPIVTVLGQRYNSAQQLSALDRLDPADRPKIALQHPVACAQFFDYMMKQFVRTVLRHGRSKRKRGLFGECDAYYGTVETQGRGTLHCHMLIWLKGHLPPESLAETLKTSEEYRTRLTEWLNSILDSGFIGSRNSLNSILTRDKQELGISEIHPTTLPGPQIASTDSETFLKEMNEHTDELLLWLNWHEHRGTCWKYLRPGDAKDDKNCRFGMDGTTSAHTVIDPETGEVTLRRRHPRMTNYSPTITFLMKCNTDVKFIGSGEEAKAFMYYVTDYITKAPLSMNAGLAALSYAIRQGEARGVLAADVPQEGLQLNSRKAMTIAVNSMLAHQEISHPQVMSYILGGGENYTNERFQHVNWGEIQRYVERCLDAATAEGGDEACTTQDDDLNVSISVQPERKALDVSNQLLDYIYRPAGTPFDRMGLYNLVASTRKVPISGKAKRASQSQNSPIEFTDIRHPQYHTHTLATRREPVIPVLLGPRIARRQGSDAERERWAKDICTLFQPWRHPAELLPRDQSWYEHLQSLIPLLPPIDQTHIENMSLLAEAKEARDNRPRRRNQDNQTAGANIDMNDLLDTAIQNDMDDHNANIFGLLQREFDEEGGCDVDLVPERLQILIGEEASKAFQWCLVPDNEEAAEPNDGAAPSISEPITQEESRTIEQHSLMMQRLKLRHTNEEPTKNTDIQTHAEKTDGDSQTIPTFSPPSAFVTTIRNHLNTGSACSKTEKWAAAYQLMHDRRLDGNADQCRAFSIIAHHAIEGGNQLLMYVGGRGGSGKSYLIQTIVDLFHLLGSPEELRLGAPTGIAASLIGGNTLHSLLSIGPNSKKANIRRLTSEWKKVKYLIVDETSMVGAQFMASMSERLKIAKGDITRDCRRMFGGVNVVFMGDFYQLSPPKQPSLFAHRLVRDPSFLQARNNEGVNSIAGAYLWRQVRLVALLKQNQRQANDKLLAELLERVRTGTCLEPDGRPAIVDGATVITHLRRRQVSEIAKHDKAKLALFRDAPVIVGSKTIRDALNACLLSSHARRLHRTVELYHCQDSVSREKVTGPVASYLRNLPSRQTQESLGQLPLFVGMKVMVTENVSVPYGVVNGSEGIVTDIKYATNTENQRVAEVVYISLKGCEICLPGLDKGVVPIFPTAITIKHTFRIGEVAAKTFRRRQVPLIPAYSYTDYKSQGRTLNRAIIDITSSRGQGIYVMLSRITSLEGLLILRWFPESKILQRMTGELREELRRLEALDASTTIMYNNNLFAPSLTP